MADYIPINVPGRVITMTASAPIAGGQLVRISGDRTVAPTSSASADWLGVAGADTIAGDLVVVYMEGIQRLVVSPAGTLTAGSTVEGAANGQVSTHTNGGANDLTVSLGIALTTAAPGALSEVSMRR